MQKITKKEMFTMILTKVADNQDMVDFINHEIELLDKKSANKKATKVQTENVGIKETILATIGTVGKGTITDLQNANTELGSLSNQKVSALVRQLIADGLVAKDTDKKKSVFFLVE